MVYMLLQNSIVALLLESGRCAPVQASSGSDKLVAGNPWQNGRPEQPAGYWLKEVRSTLNAMQSTYWNGTYWPTSIQWVSAFMDTLLAASERSFIDALEQHHGNAHDELVATASLSHDIDTYFSETEAFYGDEDVIQIFDAAYDDAQWVVLEWLEAIRAMNRRKDIAKSSSDRARVARYVHRAHIFYNIVQNQFDTSLCGGGITWDPALETYKNAITNELFISSSIAMYLHWPGDWLSDPYPSPGYENATNVTLPSLPTLAVHDPLLLQNAADGYRWFKTHNFTDAQGLIVDGFHISPNQTTCDKRNEMVYTYNQGVMLPGLRGLWEATGDSSYLVDGYNYIKSAINATGWNPRTGEWAGLGRNGIMEDYCDAAASCSQDNQIFKGIYFHHLALFCEALPNATPLIAGLTHLASPELAASHAGTCESYVEWIQHNAHAALATRNESGIMGGWWDASYANMTQESFVVWAPKRPDGSVDVWNEPWVLEQSGWRCDGGGGCRKRGTLGRRRDERRPKEVRAGERAVGIRSGDINDGGRGRTVETQASGRISKDERTIASKAFQLSQQTTTIQEDESLHFAVYDDSFLELLGKNAHRHPILTHSLRIAHEAPVYVPHQDAVYFTSSPLWDATHSHPRIAISKGNRDPQGRWSFEDVPTDVSMGNGAINYGEDGILFCAQGTKTEPGGLVVMAATPPYATQTLVDGYHGRLFNSVNDVVTHTDGGIWFTDPTYGFQQDFRHKPQLPNQVYRFDPHSGDIRVVADGFGMPNGLCFSPDEQTMYITDTDMVHGDGIDPTRAGTVYASHHVRVEYMLTLSDRYAFDVIERHGSHFLANRRVFAMADSGIPDGIKCDLEGNVYSGCGDGVNVWNAGGTLIGKIMVRGGVANFCFMRPGELLMMNETRVWLAQIGEHVHGALLHNLGIDVRSR
ncbi:hypothetical protein LTR53_016565 [Teratosphaeriaceae sp. CCFEE 6253]|nr:hypothetical protein LTR53_016565 [Teratosphaeriaceae sp. CCFEE 6253]